MALYTTDLINDTANEFGFNPVARLTSEESHTTEFSTRAVMIALCSPAILSDLANLGDVSGGVIDTGRPSYAG